MQHPTPSLAPYRGLIGWPEIAFRRALEPWRCLTARCSRWLWPRRIILWCRGMVYRRIENSISILSITWNVSSTFAESPALIIPPRNLCCLLPRPCVMLHSAIPNRVGGVLPALQIADSTQKWKFK